MGYSYVALFSYLVFYVFFITLKDNKSAEPTVLYVNGLKSIVLIGVESAPLCLVLIHFTL